MKKSTMIRSLLLSGLSVLLCVSMLMGSTFAWFTDEVKSGNNTIIAGNLDVELYNGLDNTADKVMSDTKLFDDIKLWEPGAATFENLTVANEGNLALMYNLSVNVGNAQGAANLADVLKVGVVANGIADNASREEVLAAVTEWMPFMSFVKSGKLYPANSTEGVSTTTYGIVIWWEPSDKDNDYNMNNGKTDADQLKIDIGVTLIATQVEAEQDAFGSDYDANAKNEFLAVVTADSNKPTTINSPYAPSILTPITTIEAATGSFETGTVVSAQITTSGTLFNVTAEGDVVGSINVEISAVDANGQEVSTDGKSYTVTTYVAKGLSDVVVEYTGDDGKAQPADIVYDAETGKLTFVTTHFSEYAVSGKAIAYDLAKDTAYATVESVADAIVESVEAEASISISVVGDIPADAATQLGAAIEDSIENDEVLEEVCNSIYAAKVGNVYYFNLQTAILDAADEATVTVLSNIELSAQNAQEFFKPAYNRESYCGIYIPDDKAVTIDLNGMVISYVDAYGDVDNVMILNIGNLTINDSVGGGKITYKPVADKSSYAKFYSTVFNCGTLTVNAGTIENTCDTAQDVTNAVDNHSRLSHEYGNDCILVVNGGTLTGSEYYSVRQYTHYLEGVKNRVVINGGTFNNGIYMQHGESWYYADPAKNRLNVDCQVEINGGEFFTCYEGASCLVSRLSNPDNNAWKISINGGVFYAPIKLRVQRGVYYANGVSGATVPAEATGARNDEWIAKNGGFINGGTFYDIGSEEDNTANLSLFLGNGCSFVDNDGYYTIYKENIITVTSAEEFFAALENATEGAKIDATGVTIDVKNGEILYLTSGVIIKGATFNTSSRGGDYIVAKAGVGDTLVFEDCTFDRYETGMIIIASEADGGDLVFNNCTFNAAIAPNFVDRATGTAQFNNCMFKVGSAFIKQGYVNCMGGTHIFTNCTFDYTGGSTSGSNQYVRWNAVNSYSERYSTHVELIGCTFINCGTQRYGSNSTLTIK